MESYKRILRLDIPRGQSAFLWGPRQTGKSTLLQARFPRSARIDLLDGRLALDLAQNPTRLLSLLRGFRNFDSTQPVVIDEIQLVPSLLNEVHRLIELEQLGFVMCGSSARKLVRGRTNMLGGRAWRFQLHPLSYSEIPTFDLLTALNRGLIPRHYQLRNYRRSLNGYVGDYLKQEVFAEGLTRNIPAFARFFDSMAFSHGELINYSNIARDTGVDSKTVKEYFQILVDTLIGNFVEPFAKKRSRALIIRAPKFFLFDVGVAGHLVNRELREERGLEFGRALEHFIYMELCAFQSYRELDFPIRYWRTKNGLECDFVLGHDGGVVIEVKGSSRIRSTHLHALKAYINEYSPRVAIVVCNESFAAKTAEGILVLPWRDFVDRLWNDELPL